MLHVGSIGGLGHWVKRKLSLRSDSQTTASNVGVNDLPVQVGVKSVGKHDLQLLDRVGFGGFSNVYAARKKPKWSPMRKNSISCTYYAVKVCELSAEKAHLSNEELNELSIDTRLAYFGSQIQISSVNDLETETRMLQSLQPSDYVVRLHDAFIFKPKDQFFFVLEKLKVHIGSLAKAGVFVEEPKALKSVLQEILLGLLFLKDKGIVHHDIKPDNLLVSETGNVKICDFGLAKRLESGATHLVVKATVGSTQYMAPELFINDFEYDYSVDLWAFGLVMYTLFNKGVTCWGSSRYQKFNNGLWATWRNGNEYYYHRLLHGSFTSQAARSAYWQALNRIIKNYDALSFEKKHEINLPREKLDASDEDFYSKHRPAVQVVRACVVPKPVNGPKGDIQRADLLERATVEQVLQMDYFIRDAISQHERRKCIAELVKAYAAQKREQDV